LRQETFADAEPGKSVPFYYRDPIIFIVEQSSGDAACRPRTYDDDIARVSHNCRSSEFSFFNFFRLNLKQAFTAKIRLSLREVFSSLWTTRWKDYLSTGACRRPPADKGAFFCQEPLLPATSQCCVTTAVLIGYHYFNEYAFPML
jgi:hypothetical protein